MLEPDDSASRYQTEGTVEGVRQLRRHNVGPERFVGPRYAFHKAQDEVVAMHPLRDVNQVSNQRHVLVFRRPLRRLWSPAGFQSRMDSLVSESARASSSMNPSK